MAIAPERTGIGIRRHFTTPGRTPTTPVTWERRDARIAHYATGAVAFEQLGVEVPPAGASTPPTSWPRSTSGAPSAPPSGSGRSSRSSTGWSTPSPGGASKDGYFVDDEEAEAFRPSSSI